MKTGTLIKNLTICFSVSFALLAGCKKEKADLLPFNGKKFNINDGGSSYSSVPCGKTYNSVLKTLKNDTTGSISVSNDSVNLSVTFKAAASFLLEGTSLYVGDCKGIQKDASGIPLVATFPYRKVHAPTVASYTYTIPLKSIKDSCFCILGYSKAVKSGIVVVSVDSYESWANVSGNGTIEAFTYCKQACPKKTNNADTCLVKAGEFRTQTQGGWGTTPHGNNPGTYLHKNFAGAFPKGLTIGCTYTLTLSNAQAVTNYLPGGGPATALKQNFIDPPNLKNVLVSQVITLTLSVGFDKYDANFSASKLALENLIIGSGTFKGWTVRAVLDEANRVVGGCSSKYTPSEINDVISKINENFVDGKSSGGFLIKCKDVVSPV